MPGPYYATFPAGEIWAKFDISIIDDDITEYNETFVIAINSSSLPTGVTIASPSQADRPGRDAEADSHCEADSRGESCINVRDNDSKL